MYLRIILCNFLFIICWFLGYLYFIIMMSTTSVKFKSYVIGLNDGWDEVG